jgi:hypothetical protein
MMSAPQQMGVMQQNSGIVPPGGAPQGYDRISQLAGQMGAPQTFSGNIPQAPQQPTYNIYGQKISPMPGGWASPGASVPLA